jgi:hypothetical protein
MRSTASVRGADTIRGGRGDDDVQDYTGVGTRRRVNFTPDNLYGGPGDDVIWSGHNDHVYGGAGDDRIVANYVKRGDVIACGLGRDVVVRNDDDPGLVLHGCESVRVQYAG